MDIVASAGQPMLYVTIRTSERASSIASTIKASIDQVMRFMQQEGIAPTGDPLAVFSDWNGRLVTIEAGYPVSQEDALRADGRIMAGQTPEGPAAHSRYDLTAIDYARRHEDLSEQLRAAGLRLTGTTWEVYPADGGTDLYAQLIPSGAPAVAGT